MMCQNIYEWRNQFFIDKSGESCINLHMHYLRDLRKMEETCIVTIWTYQKINKVWDFQWITGTQTGNTSAILSIMIPIIILDSHTMRLFKVSYHYTIPSSYNDMFYKVFEHATMQCKVWLKWCSSCVHFGSLPCLSIYESLTSAQIGSMNYSPQLKYTISNYFLCTSVCSKWHDSWNPKIVWQKDFRSITGVPTLSDTGRSYRIRHLEISTIVKRAWICHLCVLFLKIRNPRRSSKHRESFGWLLIETNQDWACETVYFRWLINEPTRENPCDVIKSRAVTRLSRTNSTKISWNSVDQQPLRPKQYWLFGYIRSMDCNTTTFN